jgi:poly-gamma-glutamate synthesis protein (capsule biosynthesis protein)
MAVDLWLAGDLMLGRGVDQILPHPVSPLLFEPALHDARDYVALAEAQRGPLPRRAELTWPWGEFQHTSAGAIGVVNLETAITRRGVPDPNKAIHYRMAPEHVGVLQAGGVRVCSLANNHVLDWGQVGLLDTLQSLAEADILAVGAGRNDREAEAPVMLTLACGRPLYVLAAALASCGLPPTWQARPERAGVAVLDHSLLARWRPGIAVAKQQGAVVVASLHWGGNWGWRIPHLHRRLALALIDAGVDVVHGHSSHHPLPIELYRDRLVLYGCGDLLNDYEGISSDARFHPDVGGFYRLRVTDTGALAQLTVVACERRRFQLCKSDATAVTWLREVLGAGVDPRVQVTNDPQP